jgi:hypothetical protein
VAYTFVDTATNDVGTGPASEPSNEVTPTRPAPTLEGSTPGAAPVDPVVTLVGTNLSSTREVRFVSMAFGIMLAIATFTPPLGPPKTPVVVLGSAADVKRFCSRTGRSSSRSSRTRASRSWSRRTP